MGGGLAPVGESFQRNLDARVTAIRAAEPALEVEGYSIEALPHAGFDAAQQELPCSAAGHTCSFGGK